MRVLPDEVLKKKAEAVMLQVMTVAANLSNSISKELSDEDSERFIYYLMGSLGCAINYTESENEDFDYNAYVEASKIVSNEIYGA